MESPALMALGLGLILGLKHATDADHVVAVSTIVSEYRNAWRGIWVGASWGLGHTTPLLIVGIAILLLKESVLEFYLDDVYIQSYSLPTAATGLIGVIGSASEVSEVTAWTTG